MALGLLVPIPTLPPLRIRIFSVPPVPVPNINSLLNAVIDFSVYSA
jgi:hypothetical protein